MGEGEEMTTIEHEIHDERKINRFLDFYAKGGRTIKLGGYRFRVISYQSYFVVKPKICGGMIMKTRAGKILQLLTEPLY
jgi:hypothetical protein